MVPRASRLAHPAPVVLLIIAAALFSEQGVPLPSFEKRWSIGVYARGSPLALTPAATEPVFTADRVSDIPARLGADPFLVRDGGVYAFKGSIDDAMLHKVYKGVSDGKFSPAACIGCTKVTVTGDPDPKHISMSSSSGPT